MPKQPQTIVALPRAGGVGGTGSNGPPAAAVVAVVVDVVDVVVLDTALDDVGFDDDAAAPFFVLLLLLLFFFLLLVLLLLLLTIFLEGAGTRDLTPFCALVVADCGAAAGFTSNLVSFEVLVVVVVVVDEDAVDVVVVVFAGPGLFVVALFVTVVIPTNGSPR